MRGRRGFSLVEAAIVFAVLTGLWLVLLPAVAGERVGLSGKLKCGNNLRRLALAAIQYGDDLRFFPHVQARLVPDGGMETPDTPRKLRLLVALGYHDHPEEFVCPSSDDAVVARQSVAGHRAIPPAAGARETNTGWSWRGGDAPPGEKIGATTPGLDPTLLETTELSYGWTRRDVNGSSRGIFFLAGDRASRKPDDGVLRPPGLAGNHAGGLNVVDNSGCVSWLDAGSPDAATVSSVAPMTLSPRAGWLTVEPPVAAPGVREPLRLHVEDARGFAWLVGPPAALLVLLAGGVLLARRARAAPAQEEG